MVTYYKQMQPIFLNSEHLKHVALKSKILFIQNNLLFNLLLSNFVYILVSLIY